MITAYDFHAALTAAGLFRARFAAGGKFPKPASAGLLAAGVYSVSAVYMLYFGFRDKGSTLLWWLGGAWRPLSRLTC